METDDGQLVLGCRQGQEEAYRQLLSRYDGYIYSLCYRLTGHREDALDLAQESMVRVVTGLPSYQISRPFKPWLRRLVVNVCLKFINKRQPELPLLDQIDTLGRNMGRVSPGRGSDDPPTAVEWLETRQALQQALGRLSPLLRLVIALRHQEGMTYREIAATLELPEGTVKTSLFRGRRLLRQILCQDYGWEA